MLAGRTTDDGALDDGSEEVRTTKQIKYAHIFGIMDSLCSPSHAQNLPSNDSSQHEVLRSDTHVPD